MPGGDGTGPLGMGPMTGRRAGCCGGNADSGLTNADGFRGHGKGRSRGRGHGLCRLGANASGTRFGAMSKDEEKAGLARQASALEGALEEIKARLSELDKEE